MRLLVRQCIARAATKDETQPSVAPMEPNCLEEALNRMSLNRPVVLWCDPLRHDPLPQLRAFADARSESVTCVAMDGGKVRSLRVERAASYSLYLVIFV